MNERKTILITGGSGFIGTKLTEALLDKGCAVVVVDLSEPRIKHELLTFEKLNLSHDEIPKRYDGVLYGIIHLAGKNIFGLWTEGFKKSVYDSRIESTRKIVETISHWNNKPKVLVSASAFGFYGNAGEVEVNELAKSGTDFLAKVCVDWEAEAKKAEDYGIRTVQIRTAHVLGNGGLLSPLFVPFKFGLGAWIGKGKAWLPWVHIEDIVNIYIFAVENENLHGSVNTGAPEQIRQIDFMKMFGKAYGRYVLFSIPIFLLYLRYGDLAYTFDNSSKMSSGKLLEAGFKHKYPQLIEALEDVIKNKN
jgi:uncharacterized protein (TIGR01777 family)